MFAFTDSPFILIHSFSHSVSPLYSSPTENEWMADAPSFERGRISKYKWWWWWWWPRKPGQYRYLVEVCVCLLFRIWFLSSAFMLSSSMSTVITERVFAPVCSAPLFDALNLSSLFTLLCVSSVSCSLLFAQWVCECKYVFAHLPAPRDVVAFVKSRSLFSFLFYRLKSTKCARVCPPSPPTWVCLHWWSILSFFLSAYLIPPLSDSSFLFYNLVVSRCSFFFLFSILSSSEISQSATLLILLLLLQSDTQLPLPLQMSLSVFILFFLSFLLSPSRTPLCRPASLFCCRRQLFGCLISQCYLFFFFKRQH